MLKASYPDMFITLINLRYLHNRDGDLSKAIKIYQEALQIKTSIDTKGDN